MRKKYSSDITHEQFDHILPLLENFRKKTKPRGCNLPSAQPPKFNELAAM
jgi:hypothetical protein